MIADPIEETFPVRRPHRFLDMAATRALRAPRAQDLRERLSERLAAHREAVSAAAARARAGIFALHRTDPSAAARCSRCTRGSSERGPPSRCGATNMFGLPLAFAAPAALAALLGLVALYWLLRVTPPRPRQEASRRCGCCSARRQGADARQDAVAAAGAAHSRSPPRSCWRWRGRSGTRSRARAGARARCWSFSTTAGPSAPTWERRLAAAREAMRGGRRSAGRLVALAPISAGRRGHRSRSTPAAFDRQTSRVEAQSPTRPTAPPRCAAIQRFLAANPKAEILWIADGLELGGAGDFAAR